MAMGLKAADIVVGAGTGASVRVVASKGWGFDTVQSAYRYPLTGALAIPVPDYLGWLDTVWKIPCSCPGSGRQKGRKEL